MQGTQYAPRESILCMEHFVALHTYYVFLDLEERFLLLLLNTPESIWWSGCYYGDVQTDLKS